MIKSITGTRDILPDEVSLWQHIEGVARERFDIYGYREIRTPILEETSLFKRAIGAASDIVQKEMFTFVDRGGRSITLRPEETASVVRAYLEAGFDKAARFNKFFYIGPMFRAERPQAGRLRQFHQLGVEAIGSESRYLDVEVIVLLYELLRGFGLTNFATRLNTLGCADDKARIAQELRKMLKGKLNSLCEECQLRFTKNVFRILDCKKENCRKRLAEIPPIYELVCGPCKSEFDSVQELLISQKVPYEVDGRLVRGLDYYNRTAFEVVSPDLGSQDAIAAGGRYDGLVSDLGGPRIGAVGFAIGLERTIVALKKSNQPLVKEPSLEIFIATIGEDAYKSAFELLASFRKNKLRADIDYEGKTLKSQMRVADRRRARFVIVLGEDELKKGVVTLRDMTTSTQREVGMGDVVEEICSARTPVAS